MSKLADLEDEKTERLRDIETQKEQRVESVVSAQASLRAEIESQIGQTADDDIIFNPNDTVVVRTGETVKASHVTALEDIAKVYLDQLDDEFNERLKNARRAARQRDRPGQGRDAGRVARCWRRRDRVRR